MKLYEFTVTDNQGLKENEILRQAEVIMLNEAQANAWTNCALQKSSTPERQIDGRTIYRFSVHGEENMGFQRAKGEKAASENPFEKMAASPEMEQ